MKVRMRKQYYCEFCKKNGGHAGIIRKHEERCTNNPERECGICDMLGNIQTPVKDLLKLIPDPIQRTKKGKFDDIFGGEEYDWIVTENKKEISESLKVLREKTNNCPACILAAIRQKNICGPESFFEDFDFKKELGAMWHKYNQESEGY